ncbi:prosaposin receptor GPR37-like, partial [Clarias magur]
NANRRHFRFGNNSRTRSYNNNPALGSSTESALSLLTHSKVFNELDVQQEDDLFRTFILESQNDRLDVTGVRAVVNNKTPDARAGTSHVNERGLYQRPNQTDPGSGVEKLERLPNPSAQKQPTDLPTLFPTLNTFPKEDEVEDYTDSTPLGPINTRPRGPGLPNPFHPVTGESYAAYAIIIVSVIVFTAGIIGNIAIMCAVCHNYYMRSVSNSLLANLALWDFLITFFCLPLVIFHQLTKDWLLGELSCKIIPYFE